MKNYRVWIGYYDGNYQDVTGKNMETVMRRYFGRSEKLALEHWNRNIWMVVKAAKTGGRDVLGYIME